MSDTIDRPAPASAASRSRGGRAAVPPAGLWRDLAWTAGSFALILTLLFGLAPGQAESHTGPRAHTAFAALAD